MGKPRMIILIRHAQSEGNKNRDIHQTIPDHRVKLTPEGWTQAQDAGRRLRSLLRADDKLHFFTSPYRRTRETTEGILSTLTSDDPSPSPFARSSIKVYEEPRLREQDFGNFQPCSAEMERMWQERADYGHFFYRIPNGESAADAYDRVSGFNESLWRQFGEDDCASVCILVTHGLMSRVFLMKWYHFSVEYFEDLRNVNHCEFLIMTRQPDSGKYVLENTLRTWSQLKRERMLKEKKDKEALSSAQEISDTPAVAAIAAAASPAQIPKRKQWGGCPNGCDHGKHSYKRENSMHAMQSNGRAEPSPLGDSPGSSSTLALRRPAARRWQSSSEDEDDPRGRAGPPKIDVNQSLDLDGQYSSPDGTPSFISMEDRMKNRLKSPMPSGHVLLQHMGRDFGGTASGTTSIAGSDTEISAEEDIKGHAGHVRAKGGVGSSNLSGHATGNVPAKFVEKRSTRKKDQEGRLIHESGMGRGAKADALGDQSDVGSDAGDEAETVEQVTRVTSDPKDNVPDGDEVSRTNLDELEQEEKSVRGSVY